MQINADVLSCYPIRYNLYCENIIKMLLPYTKNDFQYLLADIYGRVQYN